MEKHIKRVVSLILLSLLVLLTFYAIISLEISDVRNMPILKSLQNFFNYVFAIYIGLIAIVIFLENRNPSKTMAWLLVLTFLPGVGFVLYLFFGQNYRKKKLVNKKENIDFEDVKEEIRRQKAIVEELRSINESGSLVDNRLVRLLLNNSGAPISTGNEIEILTDGKATFDAIFREIERAEIVVNIQFFIIKNDELGNKLKTLLIKKAQQNVKVRLIYDAVGSWRLGKAYVNELRAAGVQVEAFLPVFLPYLSRELNYRNHRKIITIDGHVGFVGGLNVGDEYLGKNKKLGYWRDTHMMIKGEGVYNLQSIFLKDWRFCSGSKSKTDMYFPTINKEGDSVVQIAASGPDSDWYSIFQAYFTMIATAENRVWITTPYLVPEESLMMALRTASLSGIDVRIIIPNRPDHFFVYWASRDNIEPLLEAGIKIYEYNKGFVHSKIMIVDGVSSSVGTANLDVRSMEINFEVNAFVYDKEVAKRLEQDFEHDMDNSTEITLERHKKRGMRHKFLEACGRLVSPIQ